VRDLDFHVLFRASGAIAAASPGLINLELNDIPISGKMADAWEIS